MIWNINSAIPSFIIMILFLACFFSVPRIPILTNRLYIRLLFINVITSAMNILAVDANSDVSIRSVTSAYVINTLFFVALIARSYIFYAYSVSLVNLNRYNSVFFAWIFRIPLIATLIPVISSFKTGACFTYTGNGFEKGPFMYIVYTCMFFYIGISVLAILIYHKNFATTREFWSALSVNILLALGAVYVLIYPTSLLIDTFCLMAVMLIYLGFENPDFHTEKRTGLFNSGALEEYIREMRYKKKFLLIAFKIKNYQDIREIYGIPHMDQAIRLIGRFLKSEVPDVTAFYYKEGRFILAAAEHIDAMDICCEIRKRFYDPWRIKDANLYLNICFAKLDPDKELQSEELTVNSLLSALSRAAGQDDGYCATVEEEDIEDYLNEISVKKVLELSLEDNLVEVFLQPIVESKELRIVGAEALARIRDKDGKYISPEHFIPIAERNGCITTLGEQIFDKTCRFIKENALDSIGLSWINVNLSPIQFLVNDLAISYEEILKKNGLDRNMIHLEITEEAMVSQSLLMKQMESMAEKGFKFVLDDYGKGYSNLARLQKCPFINIKIDIELVRAYCLKQDRLLPGMVAGFKQMGYSVTAEGIETREMADAMIDIGCDYLQGFYFSKPMPMKDFTRAFAIFA